MCDTVNIETKILELLSRNPEGIPQSNLAKALGISKAYISIILRELEKQSLIYRVRIGNTYIVKPVIPKHCLGYNKELKVFRIGIVWSSEYLFLGYFAKNLREKEDIELKVHVYPSAVQAVLALIKGEVDASLSPMVTQIYGYLLSRSFYIAGGGASGGGYIYEFPESKSDIIISSEISTMDLCRYLALKQKYIGDVSTRYFSSAQEAMLLARKRLARYAVVWHPLNTEIELIGGRKMLGCLDLEEIKYCCTFAISRSLSYEVVETMSKIYRESIEMFKRDRERYVEWYSTVVGIDTALLKKAVNEYVYEPQLDSKYFVKIVDILGFEIPHKIQLYRAIHL